MPTAYLQYLNSITDKLNAVKANEKNIKDSAQAIYESFIHDGYLYIFGTGHSHMFAEELFYRAGGLVRVRPMFDERLMLHMSASKSTEYERTNDISADLFSQYDVTDKDVMIIASNSGRNAATIDMALLAKNAGATLIGLTSLNHSTQTLSRHPSGKRLFEICDIVLDNYGDVGDACVEIGDIKVSPTSTVIGCAILQAIIAQIAALGLENNRQIEIFLSSNVDGGDAYNDLLLKKYKPVIRFY